MGSWFLSCGAECAIITEGASAAADAHWSSVAGTPTIETSIVRSGSRSHKFAANATRAGLTPPVPASQSVLYFRHYLYFDAVSQATDVTLVLGTVAVANNFVLVLKTTNVIEASFGSGVAASSSAAIAANEWIGVECQVDMSANPHTIKWRMWRASTGWVSQSGGTRATSADTFTAYKFGQVSGGPTSSWNMYADDSVGFLGTTTDEQYSASTSKGGSVVRLLPTADLAHSFTLGDFKDNSGSNIATSSTTVYQLVDDSDQTSLSDYVQQAVSHTGAYVQCSFADLSTGGTPRVVGVVSTHHSSGANANEMHLRVSDDGTNWTNVWGDWSTTGKDISDTSAHYLTKCLASKPSSGSWTASAVNGMRFQWGNSDDIADVPYIDGISLEVDVLDVSGMRDPFGMSGFFGV